MDKITKWLLVAGTGKYELTQAELSVSKEIGAGIARAGFGLVVGGWKGVDYVVAEAFAKELQRQQKELSKYLIQIVRKDKEPEFKGGHVIAVDAGMKEWTESVSYADAVILIGGLGGTYETYLFASQEMKPVFPIACTEGDARVVFNDILARSPKNIVQGIRKDEFVTILGRRLNNEQDAKEICELLVKTLQRSLLNTKHQIFISYSHKDKEWLTRLRTMLKPLERLGVDVWDDREIKPGDKWDEKIQKALNSATIAIFLVSPDFIASEFIHESELPALIAAAQQKNTQIFWILLSSSMYEVTGLQRLQAAHEIERPLDLLSPAEQNQVLVEISRSIRKYIEEK